MAIYRRTLKNTGPFAAKLFFKVFKGVLVGVLTSFAQLHAQINPSSHRTAFLPAPSSWQNHSGTAISGRFDPASVRVIDGLIAYYPFTEGNGLVVNDRSDFSEALNLNMSGGIVTWLNNRNGISIASGSIIRSAGPAAKLHAEILRNRAFTYEIWCKPANTTQSGPARMVSYSIDTGNRNFTIGQQADSIVLRLRTTLTNQQGNPSITLGGLATTNESHFMVTYTAGGMERLYKNGVEIAAETRGGDLTNWDALYPLLIANEPSGDRSWLGEVYLVAIYNRALSAAEVRQNYNCGPIINRPPQAPILRAPSNRAFFNTKLKPVRLSWQVPSDIEEDSLHFRVAIDLNRNFNTPLYTFESKNDPAGFFPLPPVSQSTDSAYFELSTPLPNGIYWWRVAAWDGLEYGLPSDSRSFISDTLQPRINRLILTSPIFPPNWYNPNNTRSINLSVQYDESYAQKAEFDLAALGGIQVIANIPSGVNQTAMVSINLAGAADGSYPLTVALSDSAGNISKDSTAIALDATPPSNARASSPNASANETFAVTWKGTATDGAGSGISGMYDVRVQIDGGGWNPWLTNFAGDSATYQGAHGHTYGFEVAAYDNVGNLESFSEIPESTTRVDTSITDVMPPSILHTPTAVVEEGQSVTIQAQIQDDQQVVEAVMFYKPGGKRDYQTVPMTNVGGGVYQTTLAATVIAARGINYYLRASDGFNFSYHPAENWDTRPSNISVRIIGANNQGLVKEEPQPGGSAQSAFRMISMPLLLEDPRPQAVLEDDLGLYDRQRWRLFLYNSQSGGYAEFPSINPFSPGNAFWLIVREPNKQIDSGAGTTVATNQPFQIALQQGWNDISNPFVFPVNWSEVQVVQGNPADIMGPYTYRGQWLLPNQVTTLSPWEGYAVYSSAPAVTIAISPTEAAATSTPALWKNDDRMDWHLRLEAVCEEALDGANFIGVSQEAAAEWDKLDYLEPPAVGEYVSLRFPHDDWPIYRGAFSTDFRPPFDDGQVWHFEVATNILEAPIVLKFQNRESVPPPFQAVLLDLTTFQRLDIRQSVQYVFMPDQRRLAREFKLIVGTSAYIENFYQLEQNQPRVFSLSPNFPNPFNAGTTWLYQVPEPSYVSITVLDVLGREIRHLVSQVQQPGAYRVHWQGEADDGREAGSGIYIIQMAAGSFRQTRKVLLIR
jgi:hypothetical protein